MNMKRIFSTLIVTAVAVTMLAIPAKKGVWSTIKLADGTELRVELKGDENVNWMQAADGTCYVMNDEQYEQIDAKVIRERHATRLAARNARRKAIYASTSDGLGQKGTMCRGSVPSIGEYTIPVNASLSYLFFCIPATMTINQILMNGFAVSIMI